MDIYYLKEHMCEELDGAKDYLMQSAKLKSAKPEWSKTFYEMANTEVEHSKALYKMFNEHFKEINTNMDLAQYMDPFKESADMEYMEKMGTIKYMMETYK